MQQVVEQPASLGLSYLQDLGRCGCPTCYSTLPAVVKGSLILATNLYSTAASASVYLAGHREDV